MTTFCTATTYPSSLIRFVEFVRDELSHTYNGITYETIPSEKLEEITDEVINYTRESIFKAYRLGIASSDLEIDDGSVYTLAGGHLTGRDYVLDLAEIQGAAE